MPTGLITLPLRLGLRGARLALGVSERAVGLAWSTVEAFVPGRGSAPHGGDQRDAGAEPEARPPSPREPEPSNGRVQTDERVRDPRADFELDDPRVPSREAPPQPEPRAAAEAPPAPAPAPAPEPGHIDTEATLVESFAEPGAEDGAGAQIRIDEPWDGYGQLNASDVIARLEHAPAEELAAIQLYEMANRQRSTVLAAAERQLKARTADAGRAAGSQG